MLDELSSFLTEAQLEEVNIHYWKALTEIGEPSVDGFTQGRDISLVCGAVMFATLEQLGLHQGKRSAIARGVGHRSSIAIVNLLEHLRASTKKGVFPSGRALLRERMARLALEQRIPVLFEWLGCAVKRLHTQRKTFAP